MGISQAWKLVVTALKFCWDNLTVLVLLNLVWFFIWLAPVFLASIIPENFLLFLIATVLSLVLLGPTSAAIQYLLNRIVKGKEVSVAEFKNGFKIFFWRSELIVVVSFLILLVIVFFFTLTSQNPVTFIRLFSGIWLYLVLFWLLLFQFLFPFLVHQNIGVKLLLRRTVVLVLDNLLISLLLLLLSGLITAISIFTIIPMVILWFSVLGIMQNFIMVELLKKYD